jgi:hypothetical protein
MHLASLGPFLIVAGLPVTYFEPFLIVAGLPVAYFIELQVYIL